MTAVAAVDCGTNSTRLLISDGGRDLARETEITRLGAGVGATGRLGEEGIARTVACLRRYRARIEAAGAARVRAIATSAVRDAADRTAFLDAATEALGITPEVISGEEEARLSFAGATAALPPRPGLVLVVDVGGGSTELALGVPGELPTYVRSLDIGCVRTTEEWLRSDPPEAGELADAIDVVRGHLEDVAREAPEIRDSERLVGLAGTVTAMAAVEIGLQTYDRDRIHHFVLDRAAAEEVFRTLATERLADRIHNPGLERDRADVIVGGALIVVTIMRFLEAQDLVVSEADILDGIAAQLARHGL